MFATDPQPWRPWGGRRPALTLAPQPSPWLVPAVHALGRGAPGLGPSVVGGLRALERAGRLEAPKVGRQVGTGQSLVQPRLLASPAQLGLRVDQPRASDPRQLRRSSPSGQGPDSRPQGSSLLSAHAFCLRGLGKSRNDHGPPCPHLSQGQPLLPSGCV